MAKIKLLVLCIAVTVLHLAFGEDASEVNNDLLYYNQFLCHP